MFHSGKKPLRDTGRSFGMKMILEKRDKIFTREKYGEIAHSLERAGLLLRDAGREKEIEEDGEKLGIMESERQCRKRFIKEQIKKELVKE